MKISSINIVLFGKLINKKYELNEGLNTYILNNGEGKSTLINFIRAMFYGVGKNSLSQLRGLYMPWNESSISGSIEFIYKGINYRLQRSFKKQQKNDESHLYNLNSNEQEYVENDEYGKHFFALDEQAFMQTLFVSHNKINVESSIGLNDVLVNTINTGNAATSLTYANKQFLSYERIVKADKKDSIASKLLMQLKDERITLNKLNQQNGESIEMIKRVDTLNDKLLTIDEKINYFNEVLSYCEDKQKHDLYMRYLELKENVEIQENKQVDNTNYDEVLKSSEQYSSMYKKAFSPLLYILSSILFIGLSTLLTILLNEFLYLLILIIPVITSIIYIAYKINYNKNKKEYELKQKNFFNQYNCDNYNDFIKFVYTSKVKQENNKVDESYKEKLIEFLKENDLKELLNYEHFSINKEYDSYFDVRKIINELVEQKINIKEEIAKLNGALLKSDYSNDIALSRVKIKQLEEKINLYEKENAALIIAKREVNEVYNQMAKNFTPQLKTCFKEILKRLSLNKFKDVIIDSNLNVLLDEDGVFHELDYYSQGYKDLIYFAMRLAIIKMTQNEDQTIILLDDPFINLDKSNKQMVAKFLKEYAKESQILYFSCNEL